MADPNSAYSQALSASIAAYRPAAADDVLNNNALLAILNDKGHVDPFDGGTEITEQVLFAEVAATGWYSGAEQQSVAGTNVLTTANYAIKQHYSMITEDGLEEIQNASGETRMINLIKAKIEAGMATSKNAVGTGLFGSNTEFDGKALSGLQHLVADSPATGVTGGLDPAAQAFWQNAVVDFSTDTPGGSGTAASTNILAAINLGFYRTNRGQDSVDLIVAGDTYFGFVDAALQANQRFITVTKKVVSGFTAFEHKGASIIHDPNCSATRLYGLNTDFLFFRPFKNRNFKIGEKKVPVNQDAAVYPIWFAGNLTASSRQRHWVLKA